MSERGPPWPRSDGSGRALPSFATKSRALGYTSSSLVSRIPNSHGVQPLRRWEIADMCNVTVETVRRGLRDARRTRELLLRVRAGDADDE